MSDLFGAEPDKAAALKPLAERLRPKTIDDVIGQEQILSSDAPLGAMLASGRLSSVIFWGPPGVGKPPWRGFWQITRSSILNKLARFFLVLLI